MAGKYYLAQEKTRTDISEEELIRVAIDRLGLSQLGTFDPMKKIFEYQI
jgi:hypothetical protein